MQNSELAIINAIRAQLDALEKTITSGERSQRKPLHDQPAYKRSDDLPLLSDFYDFNEEGKRWMTCKQICVEVGLDPKQANCNMLGREIPKTVPRWRSNGKRLLLMPELISLDEKF